MTVPANMMVLEALRGALGGVADVAAQTSTAVVLTNMGDGSADNTLVAIGDTSSTNQSDNIELNFDKIGDEINALVADVAAIRTTLNALLALVDPV